MFKDFIIQEIPYFFSLPKEEQQKNILKNKDNLSHNFYLYFLEKLAIQEDFILKDKLIYLLTKNDTEELDDFFTDIPSKYKKIYNEGMLYIHGIGNNLFYLNELIDVDFNEFNTVYSYMNHLYNNRASFYNSSNNTQKTQIIKFDLSEWVRLIWHSENKSTFYYSNLYTVNRYLLNILDDIQYQYIVNLFDHTYISEDYSKSIHKLYGKEKQYDFFQEQCSQYLLNFKNTFKVPEHLENSIFCKFKNNFEGNHLDIIFNSEDVTKHITFNNIQSDIEKFINYNINELKEIELQEIRKFKMFINSIYEKSLRLKND